MLQRNGQADARKSRCGLGLLTGTNPRRRRSNLGNKAQRLPIEKDRRMGYFQLNRASEVMAGIRLR